MRPHPLFDGVLGTCSNQPLPSGLRPRRSWNNHVQVKRRSRRVRSDHPESGRALPQGLLTREVMFEAASGPLSGMKLIGFAVWNVAMGKKRTFPARQYSVNGERQSFALLRPANGDASAQGGDWAVHPRRIPSARRLT